MDIDLLAKMVKELILDRDRVVLPGLGTFVAELMPSTFSDRGYTINPPYRRLYFRSRQEDDNALVELYARSNGVAVDVAERIMTDFLTELRQVLKEKKTVIFPGLGRLRATKENNFFFVPDEDLDIYPEGFALEPISLKTHQETEAEVSEKLSQLKSIMESEEQGAVPAMQDLPVEEPASGAEASPEELHEEDAGTDAAAAATEVAAVPSETPAAAQGPSEEESGTESAAAGTPAESADAHGRKLSGAVKAVIIAVAAAVLLLILYVVLNQLFPGLFDSLLYDREQLEILDYVTFASCK